MLSLNIGDPACADYSSKDYSSEETQGIAPPKFGRHYLGNRGPPPGRWTKAAILDVGVTFCDYAGSSRVLNGSDTIPHTHFLLVIFFWIH